ncbi:MAG: hypothetical protein ABSG14_03715 [Verrucomicrobiia bacterium]|jgi:pyocin large subunit-like protein
MTHFFRKESFRLGCHIQPHRAQHLLMLDVGSLEFATQEEAIMLPGYAQPTQVVKTWFICRFGE